MLDTQPGDAVSIIECDMKVDFAAPVGYKSPEPQQRMDTASTDDPSDVSVLSCPVYSLQLAFFTD